MRSLNLNFPRIMYYACRPSLFELICILLICYAEYMYTAYGCAIILVLGCAEDMYSDVLINL